MKIQKVELANKIGKLKSIVPKRTPMAALQAVYYNKGYLIASDIELTVTVKLEGITEGLEESFLIPESVFQLISSLPAGLVEFKAKDIIVSKRQGIEMKSGKIVNKFQAEAPEQFPASKEMGEEQMQATIDAEELKAGILHVLFAVGENTSQKMMSALCMDCHDGEINLTGLDGHMIAWDKIPLEGTFKLLVPKRACQQLINLDLQGDVKITADAHTVRFETEYVTLETRLIDGNFFDTNKLFMEMPITAAVNRKEFLDAISRAALCRQDNDAIKLTYREDAVTIEINNSKNEYRETVTLNDSIPEEIRIGMDPRLLSAALKAFDSENIYMNMADSKSPMKLLSDESDLKSIVLPIMIK